MNYIIVASPDKISISMFIKFMRPNLSGYGLGEMHSFMSEEAVKDFIKDFTEKNETGLLFYYANKKINVEMEKAIPEEIRDVADVLIWFDLYSFEPKIIKDKDNVFSTTFLENWNASVEKLNTGV